MTYPIINIEYNRFLDEIFISWICSQPKFQDWKVPEKGVVLEKVQLFRDIWKDYGDMIISGFMDATGLQFKRNQIDYRFLLNNFKKSLMRL